MGRPVEASGKTVVEKADVRWRRMAGRWLKRRMRRRRTSGQVEASVVLVEVEREAAVGEAGEGDKVMEKEKEMREISGGHVCFMCVFLFKLCVLVDEKRDEKD